MSETEEFQVDSFGRTIVPRDNSDGRRDARREDRDDRDDDRRVEKRSSFDGRDDRDRDRDRGERRGGRFGGPGGPPPRRPDYGRPPPRGEYFERAIPKRQGGPPPYDRGDRDRDMHPYPHPRDMLPPPGPPPGPGPGPGPSYGHGGHGAYNRGGHRGDARGDDRHPHPHSGDRDRPAPPGPHPPTDRHPKKPKVYARIAPLMTFKSFMLSQNDDVPPEEFNRRYEQYSMQYVNDFSDAFFQETKHEEWFQERYNPLTIAEIEEDTAAWAVRESHKFKSSLSGKTAAAIKSMSLSPPPGFVTTRLGNYPKGGSGSGGGGGGAEQAAEATAGTASEEKAESDAGGEKAAEEAEASALSIDLKTEGSSDAAPAGEPSSSDASNEESEKHLAGHDRRTVYLYGIPPACDKETLREAICAILARDSVTSDERKKLGEGGVAGPMAPPERIMVAQPTWSGKHHKRFERAAWMVMSSPEAAKEAILRLRDAPIPVYEPSNPFTCEKVQQATFPLQTQMHVPRPQPPLPEKYSTAARVRSDFFKAVELAAQLDEDRGVPSNCRLQTLLDPEASPEIVSACEKATDKLDVSIAYLRRVHFVAFYAGSKFFDEAHLLAMSPCVIHRGYPYIPAPPRAAPGPPRLADGDGDGAEANDDTNGNKRKREDDDGEDDGEEGEDDDDDKEKEDIDAGEDEDNHDDDGDDDGKDEKNAVDNDKDAEVASDKPDEEDKGEADGEAAGGGAGAGEESIREEGQSVSASASASAREPTEEEKARQAHFAQLDRVRGAGRPPKQLTDRRIEDLIRDLKRKLGRRRAEARAAAEGKPLKGTIDEEDVKTIRELQQKTFDSLVVDHAKAEKEGKVRCWFANCNKLFKGIDFLRKHVKSKHTSFAWDRLLHDAEPFMRARFVAEDVRARPLPPMEMEIPGGVELKSILEILDKYAPPRYPGMSVDAPFGDMDRGGAGGPPRGRGPMGAHGMGMGMGGRGPMGGRVPFGRERRDRDIGGRDVGRDRNRGLGVDPHGRRSGGEGRGRGRDDRDRDRRHSAGPGSGSGSTFDRSAAKEYQQPTGEENSNRQISSYMDIDAPKESTATIDYGVAILPPAKKRKSIGKQ